LSCQSSYIDYEDKLEQISYQTTQFTYVNSQRFVHMDRNGCARLNLSSFLEPIEFKLSLGVYRCAKLNRSSIKKKVATSTSQHGSKPASATSEHLCACHRQGDFE
jgi:hypothetical protein